jgi:hypothetical protein
MSFSSLFKYLLRIFNTSLRNIESERRGGDYEVEVQEMGEKKIE